MKKYITTVRIQARDTPWPFKIDPDREFEFDPFTSIIVTEAPKLYYDSNNLLVKFRIDGGNRDYFIRLKQFKQSVIESD
jgi:hypothetical protein